jgi:hypothetical protein
MELLELVPPEFGVAVHAAAVNTVRDTLLNASNWPDKTDLHAVIQVNLH